MTEHLPTDEPGPDKVKGSLKIDEAVGALSMAVICVISFANVVVRYVTDFSFAFTEEFSVFFLVIMTLVGTSLAFATESHIRISFVVTRLGPFGQKAFEVFTMLATTLVFALVVYYGARLTFGEWQYEETSAGLGYPTWIYTVWLPILSVVVIIRAVQSSLRKLRGGRS